LVVEPIHDHLQPKKFFGKLFFAVAPFLNNSGKLGVSTLRNSLNKIKCPFDCILPMDLSLLGNATELNFRKGNSTIIFDGVNNKGRLAFSGEIVASIPR
jgi:hypothetical protein